MKKSPRDKMITSDEVENKDEGGKSTPRRRRYFVPSVRRSIEADSMLDVEKEVKKINSDK